MEQPKVLTVTVPEAAQKLGISRNAGYAAVKAGEIRALRLGRRLVVPLRELRRLLGEDGASEGGSPTLSEPT